jgi:hypothetical protein
MIDGGEGRNYDLRIHFMWRGLMEVLGYTDGCKTALRVLQSAVVTAVLIFHSGSIAAATIRAAFGFPF